MLPDASPQTPSARGKNVYSFKFIGKRIVMKSWPKIKKKKK